MSKILIVTNHSYMLYRFRLELIQTLRQEHEVVLLMPFVGHEEDFQALGIRCIKTDVDRRGINPKTDWKLFQTYRELLQQEKPDMVVTYSIKPNIYMGLACSLKKIPYCANVQGLGTAFQKPVLASVVSILYKMAFHRVKTVFFENASNAQVFQDRHIMKADKQVLLNGAGINLQQYPYQAYPGQSPFRFLYLGRIMEEKGVNELFAAMKRLSEAYPGEAVLDLVGFYEDSHEEQVKQLEASGVVCFYGFQSEPTPYYEKADCVVLPSYHEGMSNVLLEAAAIGRPVITSDIPGCREAVDDGVTGYLCQVRDEDSLYEKMEQMLLLGRDCREAMGLKGRRKMEQEFAKERVVDQTIRAIFSQCDSAVV